MLVFQRWWNSFRRKNQDVEENNLNMRLTDEQYDMLVKEFKTDQDLKVKSDKYLSERHKEKAKPVSESKPEEIKTVVTPVVAPKIIGKIDLDAPKAAKSENKASQQEQKVEAKVEQKIEKKEEIKIEPKTTTQVEKPVEKVDEKPSSRAISVQSTKSTTRIKALESVLTARKSLQS